MEISNSPQPVSWTSKGSPGAIFSIAAEGFVSEVQRAEKGTERILLT